MLLGYSIIAVPTGIITAEMLKKKVEKEKQVAKEKRFCNQCGIEVYDPKANFCRNCGTALEKAEG
jgi:voltage-gated potassium channel